MDGHVDYPRATVLTTILARSITMATTANKAQPVRVTKPGFWSTLAALWSMVTLLITKSERILDESLSAVEDLSTMAHSATTAMHKEQLIAAEQSLAELKDLS